MLRSAIRLANTLNAKTATRYAGSFLPASRTMLPRPPDVGVRGARALHTVAATAPLQSLVSSAFDLCPTPPTVSTLVTPLPISEDRNPRAEATEVEKTRRLSLILSALAAVIALTSAAETALGDSPAPAPSPDALRDIRAMDIDPEGMFPDLPIYTLAEVAKHASMEDRIWIAAHGCVYDVTDFIEAHPGGDKILMAKGASAEPYWQLYPIHYHSKLVPEMLNHYRIGVLAKEDRVRTRKAAAAGDPFAQEPERHPALIVLQEKPFNAASPMDLIIDEPITPIPLTFTRNHHPVPVVDPETFRLTIGFAPELQPPGAPAPQVLTVDDVRAMFPPYEVISTIVCAGNRRDEMNAIDDTDGLSWKDGAVSTNVWRGARLRDIARACGLHDEEQARTKFGVTDVIFTGCDEPFDASVPIERAISASGHAILAYEMNGEPIPRDHGFPLRAIIPGTVGVRNVKWVKAVTFAPYEAKSVWQRGPPYKGFAPGVKSFAGVDAHAIPSVQALPVMSAIVRPKPGEKVFVSPVADTTSSSTSSKGDGDAPSEGGATAAKYTGTVDAKGWAYSGGGRGIVRVDVTADGGKTWTTADVESGPSRMEIDSGTAWKWTVWTASVPLPETVKPGDTVTVAAKAVDAQYNQQPEKVGPLWNRRGIMNNAWHTVDVKIAGDDDE